MPVSSLPKPCPNSLAELALMGAISGRVPRPLPAGTLGTALRQFWSASRTLQNLWRKELSVIQDEFEPDVTAFERISLEVFITEMFTRVWSTHWTINDRSQGFYDVERILANNLNRMGQIRREVLLLMVRHWQGPAVEMVSRIDRFRRRSERWTDLLIAGSAVLHNTWDFAVEPERARDFGRETWTNSTSITNVASLLVSAGLRVMFGSPWPLGCCRSEPFAELIQAVRATLPDAAYLPDGTLRPVWEWSEA